MHHAEAEPTDWLELAEDMRRLSDAPNVTDARREMYLRATMHYEADAVIQALILAAGRLAEHTGMPPALFCGHGVEATRRLIAEREEDAPRA